MSNNRRGRSRGPANGAKVNPHENYMTENMQSDQEGQKPQRITQQDVDDVCVSYERRKVGDWFMHMITSYKGTGEDAGKDLKEAILNDLMAWSVLGSFLSAIAFELLFDRIKADKTDTMMGSLVEAWEVFNTKGSWSLLELLCFKHMINSDWCYICLFMYAATSSLKGVICGTFKYLMFVPCPPSHIGKAMSAYIDLGFTSNPDKSNEMTKSLAKWVKEPFYNDWNHQDPIILSTQILLFAACLTVFLEFGLLPSIFVAFLAAKFNALISKIRTRTYAASWHYLTKIQEPLYKYPKIQNYSMAKMKEHFEIHGENTINEDLFSSMTEKPMRKNWNPKSTPSASGGGLDRFHVPTLDELNKTQKETAVCRGRSRNRR